MGTHTRTNTYYFHIDDLEDILSEYDKLRDEWNSRRSHVSLYNSMRGDALLDQLRASIHFLYQEAE